MIQHSRVEYNICYL